ncbi:helicase [Seminavis robusta]|uniref:Helicase n=1 Tax=Seminavis robusta TaxID=568900 RepID=A0A9N8D9I3_9STRA|nr:helicase [Seminavis robusta]|eukprot:Sro8_g006900.1 helicase (746) ;mRNA; r:228566-231185
MMKRSHSPEEDADFQGDKRAKLSASDNTNSGSGSGADWETLFQRLVTYKEQHGHSNVPLHNEDDPELAQWVAKQRELRNSSQNAPVAAAAAAAASNQESLTEEQMAKLAQVGFEWQPRNPRHLQWETRFSQLQSFKKKYGHAQVPIGWSENVQLANWVSKQRQEYKNLLRGRTTRLDENRIRLLNSVGFAWQLQRGGRRRQLKARSSSGSKGSDGDSSGSEKEGTGNNEGPCILPGEVLIGQGAAAAASANDNSNMPMSPTSAGSIGAPEMLRRQVSGNSAAKRIRESPIKAGLGGGPLGLVGGLGGAAAGRFHPAGLVQGPTPSPLGQSQPLRQSLILQQMQQQQPQLPQMQTMAANSASAASSANVMNNATMGFPFFARGNSAGGNPGQGAAGTGTAANNATNNNDLIEYMLARNALFQNLQRPATTTTNNSAALQANPTSLQMLGATGGATGSAFSRMTGLQGSSTTTTTSSSTSAQNAQSQLLSAAAVQRNSLLPMLSSSSNRGAAGPSSNTGLLPATNFGGPSVGGGHGGGSTGGANVPNARDVSNILGTTGTSSGHTNAARDVSGLLGPTGGSNSNAATGGNPLSAASFQDAVRLGGFMGLGNTTSTTNTNRRASFSEESKVGNRGGFLGEQGQSQHQPTQNLRSSLLGFSSGAVGGMNMNMNTMNMNNLGNLFGSTSSGSGGGGGNPGSSGQQQQQLQQQHQQQQPNFGGLGMQQYQQQQNPQGGNRGFPGNNFPPSN